MSTNLFGIAELSVSLGAYHFSPSNAISPDSGFSSVAIDSRKVKQGGLFFALKGAACDGHEFVQAAFNAGAAAAMVESSKIESFNLKNIAAKAGKDLIIVENTLKGLQDSAKVYLEKFPNLVKVGITGSSGKTTTKEITAAIVSCEKNVIRNEGNLNSETGLPVSVFEVRSCHEVGIFELGMNRPGEILEIAEVLKPNIALITNIGSAHIEFFGSREKIVNEKKSIFNFLKNDDTALIPGYDKETARALSCGVSCNVKYFGESSFSELEGTRSLGLDGTEISWAGEKIRFALPGRHCLEDAMAAIAIAKEINVGGAAIKKGLESVKPMFGRLEIIKTNADVTVIQDCYNANPESTAASIEFCDSVEWQGRKIYVIADMLELGDASGSEHEKLGNILASSQADMIFLFGSEIEKTASVLRNKNKSFKYTNDIKELSHAFCGYVKQGDMALLKGSRGRALERLTQILISGKGVDNVS